MIHLHRYRPIDTGTYVGRVCWKCGKPKNMMEKKWQG